MKRNSEKKFDVFLMSDIENTLCDIFLSGGKMTVYPKGTSMLPTLKEGRDSVELSPVSDIVKNNIYLYKRARGDFALHRLLEIKEEYLIFSGDNQLVTEKVRSNQLLACVTLIYREEKEISHKLWYKLFVFINSVFIFRKVRIKWRKLKKRFLKNPSSKTK